MSSTLAASGRPRPTLSKPMSGIFWAKAGAAMRLAASANDRMDPFFIVFPCSNASSVGAMRPVIAAILRLSVSGWPASERYCNRLLHSLEPRRRCEPVKRFLSRKRARVPLAGAQEDGPSQRCCWLPNRVKELSSRTTWHVCRFARPRGRHTAWERRPNEPLQLRRFRRPRSTPRAAHLAAAARLHVGRRADARPRHRRDDGDLQRCLLGADQAIAVSELRGA